nr:immunoglobulin heavy chain junction region [Macaca mulatta]MOX59649.1 immunoglobulin heavy chain junction region [Macaca mulatta]MOX60126.1 immunoglobulin heavy chain junction region [Macaca mulatta]MOX63362.1 immunoglobulin heavy chain junction region [Macaca mulatta]MOX65434.1 immunoglobulin heavy chain junction region [Macaca mulatta]
CARDDSGTGFDYW